MGVCEALPFDWKFYAEASPPPSGVDPLPSPSDAVHDFSGSVGLGTTRRHTAALGVVVYVNWKLFTTLPSAGLSASFVAARPSCRRCGYCE